MYFRFLIQPCHLDLMNSVQILTVLPTKKPKTPGMEISQYTKSSKILILSGTAQNRGAIPSKLVIYLVLFKGNVHAQFATQNY